MFTQFNLKVCRERLLDVKEQKQQLKEQLQRVQQQLQGYKERHEIWRKQLTLHNEELQQEHLQHLQLSKDLSKLQKRTQLQDEELIQLEYKRIEQVVYMMFFAESSLPEIHRCDVILRAI